MSCGFDSMPNQVTTRRINCGLSFNVLVVGSTGIGKTTLINSLFNFDYGDTPDLERKLTKVEPHVQILKPDNKTTEINFTIIESKGFDNQLDKTNSYKPLIDYIEARFKDYLDNELEVESTEYKDISDSRVHCCIYMISPTGNGLRALDLVTMKELHRRVCLIPVIAKSDVLTESEKQELKEKIRHEIMANDIQVFSPEDLPLAIAASNDVVLENTKRTRARMYPWGKINIEENSEFTRLMELVLRNDMLSLVDKTNRVHYEEYRREVTSVDMVVRDFQEYKANYETKKMALMRDISKLEALQLRSPHKRIGTSLSGILSN